MNQQLLTLNSEKALTEELSLIQNVHSEGYEILILKIILVVGLIVSISWLIYFLSASAYSFFFPSSVANLVVLNDNLGLDLLGFFGFLEDKQVSFSDHKGNNFIVALTPDEKSVEILVQGIGTSTPVSLTDFLTLYGPALAEYSDTQARFLGYVERIF